MVNELSFRIQWWRCGCIDRRSALWQLPASALALTMPGPPTWKTAGKMAGSWANCQELHSRTLTLAPTARFPLACFSESSGFSWPAASPSDQPCSSFLPACRTLGMCSQISFPPAPGLQKEQLSGFATPTPRRGLGGLAFGIYLILSHPEHSLLGSGSQLSDHADHVPIGVHLGVYSCRLIHMFSLCKDSVIRST